MLTGSIPLFQTHIRNNKLSESVFLFSALSNASSPSGSRLRFDRKDGRSLYDYLMGMHIIM